MILGRALSEDELLIEIDAYCQRAGITRIEFLQKMRSRADGAGEILAGYDRGETVDDLAARLSLTRKYILDVTKIRRPGRPKSIRLDAGTHKIPLTLGLFAIIDDCDLQLVARYRWQALFSANKSLSYAIGHNTSGAPRRELMHRAIMKPPKGMVVDHINKNGLDNRRSNLRIASIAQNSWNRARGNPTSGYHGVAVWGEKYRGIVMAHGKTLKTDAYDTPHLAAAARDALVLLHHGEFAVLNFPADAAGTAPSGEVS